MDERSPVETLGVDEETDLTASGPAGKDKAANVADCPAATATYGDRAANLATVEKSGKVISGLSSQEKGSLLGRLQEKKTEISNIAKHPAIRARPEPAL